MKNTTLVACIAAAMALNAQANTTVAAPNTMKRIVLPSNASPTHYTIDVVPDAEHMRFDGEVTIDFTLKQASNEVVINAADLDFERVSFDQGVAATFSFDKTIETATLTTKKPLSAGKHQLHISYHGTINPHTAGLFALDYDSKEGKKRALFTQFENSDARRMFPGWDEPGIKTTFDLSATVPEQELPVSNTPIKSVEKLADHKQKVHFATTPKMSTYLLFFGSGEFERASRVVDGVDIGVIVKKGDTAKANYALQAAAEILPYYQDYFGVKFPLPKLDMIAAPGQSQTFGAMENWGAIFYFEYALLSDDKLTTEGNKRYISSVIAHEMAHQWFGDLVTMAWWDDLWLNEGFASWMTSKATNHLHPEWKVWEGGQDGVMGAMRTDAQAGTHAVIQPIYNVLQANQAFDAITYQKGSAVIRMLEAYIGEDNFRNGVRQYMKKYAYKNTVTDDLWREIDSVSTIKLAGIAHDFTQQAGIPMINVEAVKGGWKLTQSTFAIDDSTPADRRWHVPVNVRNLRSGKTQQVLVSNDKPVLIAGNNMDGLIVNVDQTAYFRTRYSAEAFAGVMAAFDLLTPAEQQGLSADGRELAYAGFAPLSQYLSLFEHLSPRLDATVQTAMVSRLQGLSNLYRDLPGEAAFKEFSRQALQSLFAKYGWDAKPDDDANTAELRAEIIATLSALDDKAVLEEAAKRFSLLLKDKNSLSAETRHQVLEIVAENANETQWEQIHQLAKAADTALEKQELYGYLCAGKDKALVKKGLQLSLSDEVPATTRPNMISHAAGRFTELALDFVEANLDSVNEVLEPGARARFVPRLMLSAMDRKLIDRLNRYADANIPANARQDVTKAISRIQYMASIRESRLPELDRWLAARANNKSSDVLSH